MKRSDEPSLGLIAEQLIRQPCRLELSLASTPGKVHSSFDRALRIAEAEPLFEALEHWLSVTFDVTPDDAASVPTPEPVPLRLHLAHRETAQSLVVHLPAQALGFLPAIPKRMSSDFVVQLEPVSATCRIARLELPADQLAQLTPGAVMLLPDTFNREWTVHLVAHGVAAKARFNAEDSALVVSSGPLLHERLRDRDATSSNEAEHGVVDIVLDSPFPWDPIAVLVRSSATRLEFPSSLCEGRFLCRINECDHLAGHVSRLGDGYGFFATERCVEEAGGLPPSTFTATSTAAATDKD